MRQKETGMRQKRDKNETEMRHEAGNEAGNDRNETGMRQE